MEFCSEESAAVATPSSTLRMLWPDKPPGTIYYALGLPSASLGRPTRLALGKPRVQQMAPGCLSGQSLMALFLRSGVNAKEEAVMIPLHPETLTQISELYDPRFWPRKTIKVSRGFEMPLRYAVDIWYSMNRLK